MPDLMPWSSVDSSTSPAESLPPRPGLRPHKLHRVLTAIESRYAENLGVRDLAAEVNMSPFHFARMFKNAMGHPPHAFITLVRMERAKHLLATSTMPVLQVAQSVGYHTQAHFTGVFHRRVGLTPRVYRLKNRSEGATNGEGAAVTPVPVTELRIPAQASAA